jgi:hypothetical protein
MKTKQRFGWGSGVGSVLALALGGLAACGSAFESDCRETRTCPAEDDNRGGESAGGVPGGAAGSRSQTDGGGADAAGGAGAETAGGAGDDGAGITGGAAGDDAGASATAGAGGTPDCHLAANCFNPSPRVVAITPRDEASAVEPDTKIVIELSEPLDAATVSAGNVQVLDGGVPVPGQLSYADSKITFTPDKPLALLAAYQVVLSSAVTDVEGAGLEQAFASSFAVRDGAWSVTTVLAGAFTAAPSNLQLNADGRALVTWIGASSGGCPATALWYVRGQAIGTAKTFTGGHGDFCADIHSAVSPSGLALLTWYEESNADQGAATVEFRGGKWGGVTLRSARYDNYNGAAAVSDDGTMHYFGAGSDAQVWQTSTSGVWSKTGKQLSAVTPLNGVHVAVAQNGDALAAWSDIDAGQARVVASRYSKSSATWSNAVVLPGSLGELGGAARGTPAVAFDEANEPMVVWQRGTEMVASRFDSNQGAWTAYVKLAGSLKGVSREAPTLVFDGHTFVVAYAATRASGTSIEAARLDRETDTWGTPETLHSAATKPVARMPRLTVDAHGNLLLVWASAIKTNSYALDYQRFDAAAKTWLGAKPIEGVTIDSGYFTAEDGAFSLGGSAGGLAALTFFDLPKPANAGDPAVRSNLRLASFY